jgi:hypothetical protein
MKTLRIRWWIYACMFGFAALAYVQRTTKQEITYGYGQEKDYTTQV